MNFRIGQKVTFSAQNGEILTIEAGKRGRMLATIKLASGRVLKVDTRTIEDTATAIDNGFNPGMSKHGGSHV